MSNFSMRMVLPVLTVVLAVISTGAIANERSFFDWLDGFFEKKHYSTQDDVRHVRVAGVDLWIPRNYKMGSYNDSNLDQETVLLQLLLPDFEPKTEKNIAGFTEGTGHGDRLRILLNDFSMTTDLDYRYRKTLKERLHMNLLRMFLVLMKLSDPLIQMVMGFYKRQNFT